MNVLVLNMDMDAALAEFRAKPDAMAQCRECEDESFGSRVVDKLRRVVVKLPRCIRDT